MKALYLILAVSIGALITIPEVTKAGERKSTQDTKSREKCQNPHYKKRTENNQLKQQRHQSNVNNYSVPILVPVLKTTPYYYYYWW